MLRDGRFHAVRDELHALLDFADFFGNGGLAQLDAGAGFIDQVDCFVRQEAVRNVAVRKIDGVAQGFIRVADGVKFFVAFANALDYLDGFFFIRRGNFYGLEAALERAVFFDGLAVFAGRGCANALNFAARKCGLQDIRGIERTFRGACANQCVQLVDKDDGVLALHQFFHDGLQPLFELAAVFRARDDERKIEGENAFIREKRRNIAIGNALRQAFDDGRLSHAGLANEHRIIFGAPAKNLDDALDFTFAADQRVQASLRRQLA